MLQFHFSLFQPAVRVAFCLSSVLWMASCSSPSASSDELPPGTAFLSHGEEETYSEVLQAKQRIILQIELVDTVRPQKVATIGGARGFVVPAGKRRVRFRVVLPSAGWTDSRSREARGYFDVDLAAGHNYRVAGRYTGNARTFRLIDLATGQAVSAELDLGFFGPVRQEMQFVPLILPIKS